MDLCKNILLTGPPGCGKTTVILRLVDLLGGYRLAGFHTHELREKGQRTGFEAVGLASGLRTILAHVDTRSRFKVGRYGVEPDRLDPLVRAELKNSSPDLFVIDEIGKMELFCPEFVEAVGGLLDAPTAVVATVALKGKGLIDEVKKRGDIRLVHVSAENRDRLPEELAMMIRGIVGH